MQETDLEAMQAEANKMNELYDKINEVKAYIADMKIGTLVAFRDFLKSDTTGSAIIAEQLKVVEAKVKELTPVE